MMADTSILANSPWQSDTWLARDSCLGSDLEECDPLSQLEEHVTRHPTLGTSVSCSSRGGSECSEDLGLDELPWSLDDNDIMQHTMMNLLGDAAPNSPESECVVSLDSQGHLSPTLRSSSPLWCSDYSSQGASQSSNEDSQSTHSSVIPSCPPSPHIIKPKSLHRNRKHGSLDYRKWSEMNAAEQVSLVEDLTAAISRQLGLREQLEVISIIKPDVALTARDTEFAIELSWLNEKKLRLVYDYLEKNQRTDNKTSKSDGAHHNKTSKGENVIHGRSKRKQRSRLHHESKRGKKEHQQVVKEERSGLFREEQVLSLAACSRDEDEDVDILT